VAVNVVAAYVAANHERLALDRFGVPRRPACVVLAPRFRRSRHVVVLVLGSDGRTPVLVGKLARLPRDRGALAREARNLRAVTAVLPGAAPELVAHHDDPRCPLLLQTALAGRPLSPAAVRRDAGGAVATVSAWLERLAAASATTAGDDGWYERLVAAPLTALAGRGSPSGELARRTLDAAQPLRDSGIPLVFEHGDLGHPNLLLEAGVRLGVLDWERAQPHGLPLADLVFFLVYATGAAGAGRIRPWTALARHAAAIRVEGRLVWPLVAVACARAVLDGGAAAGGHVVVWEQALRAAASAPAIPAPTPVPA
jgi:aminoglycoside phosphotransferase (APT) family kinase protein